MKKVISILIIMVIAIFGVTNVSNANDTKNVELDFKNNTEITDSTKTVELTLSITNITGMDNTLGYTATLDYKKDSIKSINVTGMNGWNASFSAITSKIQGDTAQAEAGKDIAKINLTLNDNIDISNLGNIQISNIELSDGNGKITAEELSVDLSVQNTDEQEKNTSTSGNQETANGTSEQSKNTKNANLTNSDKRTTNSNNIINQNTSTATSLPAAGYKNIIISAIILMIILVALFKIKSRKIKY